jgi:MFS family permease
VTTLLTSLLERYPALTYAPYRRYWFASFASVGATQLITLGQGWLIFELTGSALQLGLLGAAASVPNILMTLFGGVIADRFDKRQILRLTSAVITGLLVVLTLLDFSGLVQVWQVITIAALFSLITGLDWPARAAIYPLLVERHAFMSAVALNSFIWQATRMAIPALGGVLMYVADTWLIFALASCGFFIMFLVISGIHVKIPDATHHSPLQQLLQGMAFIFHNSIFKWLLGLTFLSMFLSQSYVQILPVFVGSMGMAEQAYGYLLSAGGIGSIIGTLIAGAWSGDKPIGHYMFAGTALSVVALLGFVWAAAAGHFPWALLAVFLAAVCSSVYMIVSMTILQARVPDELRGRVMGIYTIGYSLIPLGGLFLGSLAEEIGAGRAVLYASSAYLLIALAVWAGKTSLRSLTFSHTTANS